MNTKNSFNRNPMTFDIRELHRREADCTRVDPPECNRHCPIGVDVREISTLLASGDFDKGFALLQKATPFVRLVSHACEAPCEKSCILESTVGGIRINALEKACVRYGKPKKRRFLLPRKTQKVAVIGDDLYALATAVEIGLRGYMVTHFSDMEAKKLMTDKYKLTEEDAGADLSVLGSLKYKTKQRNQGGSEEHFDAVCMSNPEECKNSPETVFRAETDGTLIGDLELAAKTALSIDHYLQGAACEFVLQRGQPQESRLYVSPDDIAHAGKSFAMTEEKKSAIKEAARCIRCRCEECIRSCAFLQHYKTDPRRSIREIYNNLSIVIGTRQSNTMINSCALCGQCTVRCPFDFDMEAVVRHARETMVEKENMPPSTHEFILLDMKFSNEDAYFARPAWNNQTEYLFFPGCQMASVSPDTVLRAYYDLRHRLKGRVGILSACCGIIAEWAGRRAEFEETIRKIRNDWEKMGKPVIIAACPTCRMILQRELQADVKGIWELLEEIGCDKNDDPKKPVILHDACGARGDKETQESVRRLMSSMGYEVEESRWNRNETACCGWGGLVSSANPELAGKMASFCTPDKESVYVSYCMGCRDRFAREGKESRHILELVYGTDDRKIPDISERRKNRFDLKKTVLQEVYGETMQIEERDYSLVISEEIRELLDRRMILISDLYEVFDHLQKEGDAIRDEETGLFLTRHRLGNVTFWVNYQELEDGYEVKSAYSHRMTVEEL